MSLTKPILIYTAFTIVLWCGSFWLWTSRVQAQTEEHWNYLGAVDGCSLHRLSVKTGSCYVLTCDSGQAALSCR